jgi:hypothetical protein
VTMFSVLAIGFVLGLKHATEADHLTAVATLATKQSSLLQILRQGVAWGLGHSLTLLSVGLLVLALGHDTPAWLAEALECAVGAMLMVLGADVLRRVFTDRELVRSDPQVGSAHAPVPGLPLRALIVGMVHGMAGSAALIVLSLGAMQSRGLALLYVAVFGIGSISGMAVLSVAMAGPLRLSAKWLGEGYRQVTGAIGVLSCVLGAVVVYRIAF